MGKSTPNLPLDPLIRTLRRCAWGGGLVILLGLLYWDVTSRRWHIDLPDDPTSAWRFVVVILWVITLPALVGFIFLHNRDKFHDESWRLLGKLFVLGALVGPVAGMGEWLYYLGMDQTRWAGTRAESFLHMYFVVAVLEEGVKFSVVWFMTYRTALFKQVFDGVLFCAASALGFATIENVAYVFTGGDMALGIAVARAITPMHIVFGIVMGYGMGRARAVRGTPREVEWLVLGFLAAVGLHGSWNFLIGFRSVVSALNLVVFFGGWIAVFTVIRKAVAYSPFVRCSRCHRVIPRLSSYCPFCHKPRRIYLKCSTCGEGRPLDEQYCGGCHTRVRRPWHLQDGRIPELYPSGGGSPCPACGKAGPPGAKWCLHCGTGVG